MSLDQNDDNIDVQEEYLLEGLTDEQRQQLAGSEDLSFYVEQLAQSKPEKNLLCTQSVTEESRTFTQKQILRLMASFGLLNTWKLDALKITNIVLNPLGNIVYLELRGPDASDDPREGYQELVYMLRGKHHDGVYQSDTSNIEHLFLSQDGQVEWAKIVAQYENGAWTFSPDTDR